MHYSSVVSGIFLRRPNRFIAHVLINGQETVCHVKNTGRCRELLLPGVTVILSFCPEAAEKGRKTAYDLIAVYKETGGKKGGRLLINLDSQAPNEAAFEWAAKGGLSSVLPQRSRLSNLRREVVFEHSRFDLSFLLDGVQSFMEVKGVTLENGGVAAFPDAPTQRGVKHLEELADAARRGFPAFLLLVIQMTDIVTFQPNMETHPDFGRAMVKARQAGVQILARDCQVTEDSMTIQNPVAVDLSPAENFLPSQLSRLT